MTPEQLASLYADDSIAPVTNDAIVVLGNLYDEFSLNSSSSVVYIAFVERSHDLIRRVQDTIPEHEIYLVYDVHYDLLHEAFAQHFKNTQNS